MFSSKKTYFLVLALCATLLFLVSCDNKEETDPQKNLKRMNYFSMEIDGEFWQPSFIDGDTCKQTFNAAQSGYNANIGLSPSTFYNINAYKDPNAINDVRAENRLRLQIMDVVKTGKYEIKKDYRVHFENFISFQIRKDKNGNEKQAIYSVDSTKNIFDFYVDKIIPVESIANQGIQGHFEGVLYNEENPIDSIVITNGKYKFERLNWTDNCHCEK